MKTAPLSGKKISPVLFLTLTMLLLPGRAALLAQEIAVTGSWYLTIDVSYLLGGAGSDFASTYESLTDQVEGGIKGKKVFDWQVEISLIPGANWHPDFVLSAQRTSDGIGSGTISGGTSYQEVTETSSIFFQGGKNRKNITIQYQLSGFSTKVPTGTYTTTVVYMVTAI